MSSDLEAVAPATKPKRKTNPETRIVKQIQAWCKRQPETFCYKIPGGRFRTESGFFISPLSGMPDLLIIQSGRSVFFEIKTETGKLSDAQKTRIAELAGAGAEVHVAHSLEEVKAVLKGEEE